MNIIVFEHPRIFSETHFNDIANTPLWSCLMGGYAASALKNASHEVQYIDAVHEKWDFSRSLLELSNRTPDMICFNAVYFWENTGQLFEMLFQLRLCGFQGHINLFGFFPTLAWESILTHCPAVDSIAVGEPEHTLCELAGALDKKTPLDSIAGLAVRASSGIRFTRIRQPEKDPDRFPPPIRCHNPGDTIMILASRGCYNHCTFCPVPSFYNQGPLWRGRSPEKVVEEIAFLKDQGASEFYFVDPNFIGPGKKGRERALKLADLIHPLNITFGMETRPDDLTPEILEKLTASGFTSLLLGIESGSGDMLKQLKKSVSRNVGENAIRLCRTAGIEPEIGFLMFVPDSTLEDLENNFRFLEKNRLLDRLERTANLLCHRQIVLAGTLGYRDFMRQGRLIPNGSLGFQGDVAYQDFRVKWMSELVPHACLSVLRQISRANSPLYWKTCEDDKLCARVNHYLVELFQDLLKQACREKLLSPVGQVKQEIDKQIMSMLCAGTSEKSAASFTL